MSVDLLFDVQPAVLMSGILSIAQKASICWNKLLGSVVEHTDGIVAIRGHGHTRTVHCL
jgi:hypothetical protein